MLHALLGFALAQEPCAPGPGELAVVGRRQDRGLGSPRGIFADELGAELLGAFTLGWEAPPLHASPEQSWSLTLDGLRAGSTRCALTLAWAAAGYAVDTSPFGAELRSLGASDAPHLSVVGATYRGAPAGVQRRLERADLEACRVVHHLPDRAVIVACPAEQGPGPVELHHLLEPLRAAWLALKAR